jgi:hypothetical protein
MNIGRCVLALGASIGLAACSTTHMDTAPTAASERAYSALYPYYAEICALSELKKKPGFGVSLDSGAGGHAVLYLNGVCRDGASRYPSIGLCDAGTPAERRGVGISVNAHYKNANWIATEGREFFYHGTLKPGEPLTRAAYERTQARAKAMGILDGVEFHPEVFDDISPGVSRRDHMYEVSVATDYAIGFGRDRYCARVPLDGEKMTHVVDFLNGLNAPYADGKKDFEWDVLRNNCSHVAHNALATAGVWDTWPTERFILLAAFDFPVPKNEFVNLMRRTNDMPIDDLDSVYDDASARRALMQADTLPTGPGALAEAEPAVQDNEVYDTDLALIFYETPIFSAYDKHFDQIFAEPRYFDLRANLQYFADLYGRIERERRPVGSFLAGRGAVATAKRDELARFHARYYRYVARQEARVSAGLASLPPLPATVATVPQDGSRPRREMRGPRGSADPLPRVAAAPSPSCRPVMGFPEPGGAVTMNAAQSP